MRTWPAALLFVLAACTSPDDALSEGAGEGEPSPLPGKRVYSEQDLRTIAAASRSQASTTDEHARGSLWGRKEIRP